MISMKLPSCMSDRQLCLYHASAHCAENLAQLRLSPHRSEHAGGCTDDSSRLAVKGALSGRAGDPVEGVLELARDRVVVLGGGDQDRVGVAHRSAQLLDHGRGAL